MADKAPHYTLLPGVLQLHSVPGHGGGGWDGCEHCCRLPLLEEQEGRQLSFRRHISSGIAPEMTTFSAKDRLQPVDHEPDGDRVDCVRLWYSYSWRGLSTERVENGLHIL